MDAWRAAMVHSIYGPGSVTDHGLFLGLTVSGPDPHGHPTFPIQWLPPTLLDIARRTWEPATTTAQARAGALASSNASVGIKANKLNDSVVPLVNYLAPYTSPDPGTVKQWRAAARLAVPSGTWIRWDVFAVLGLSTGVRGAPRDPEAVIATVQVISGIKLYIGYSRRTWEFTIIILVHTEGQSQAL